MDKEFGEYSVYGIAKGKEVLIEVFSELLKESPYFATRGLVELNKREQFKEKDSKFLSSLAVQFIKNRKLSDSQMRWAHKLIPSYSELVVEALLEEDEIELVKGDIYVYYWYW